MEDQERGRANAGSSDAEPCGANVGGNKGSIFGPGRPPQVERMAHALRLHRGNVGDLWMQLRSLSHELDDRLEGFAGEARAAASHIGGLIDVILEAAASDKLDSVVRCACLQDRRCRGGGGCGAPRGICWVGGGLLYMLLYVGLQGVRARPVGMTMLLPVLE